jgi:twinkle protein
MQQGYKVCIASFEMKPKRTMMRMLRQFSRENIDVPMFTASVLHRHLENLEVFTRDKLWFYDHRER